MSTTAKPTTTGPNGGAPLAIPTIHLNGTSRESLVEELCEASNALNEAHSKLRQAAPNGRDYYPQGPAAAELVIKQHSDRLRRLDEIKKEIDDLTWEISQGGK